MTRKVIYGKIEEWCKKSTPERMFNKVENNSKSGLKIRQIILSVLILMILSSNIQLFISTKEENANVQEEVTMAQNTIQEETEIADYYERDINTTARSSAQRTELVEQEQIEEITYKSIDEITISKNMDLTIRCGISKEDFKELMKNLKTPIQKGSSKNTVSLPDTLSMIVPP